MTLVSARESVIQGVRLFLKGATGLADAKVLVAGDDDSLRPAMPYLTVEAFLPGRQIGTDERCYDLGGVGGTQRMWVRGHRRATVSVTAYGRAGADLLEDVRLATEDPTKRALTTTVNYAVSICRVLNPRGALFLRDTAHEAQATLDLEVAYRLETAPAAATTADHLHFDLVLDRTPNPPADLVFDFTKDV